MDPSADSFTATDAATAPKADLARRFIATFIDGVLGGLAAAIIGIFIPVLGGLVSAAYFLVRDGLELSFMNRRSIGKQLLNLKPVRLDGQPMDIETSIRRNWMFAIGGIAQATFTWNTLGNLISLVATAIVIYEIYKVFTDREGRRWGDEMAGTKVVEG